MYAKLVTKAGSATLGPANSTTNSIANVAVWFNTIIDVITGTVSNVSSVNSTIFDTGLCEIISNVATGWTLYDNTASNSVFVSTPAAPPVIIRAPYTDNASAYKYLWVAVPANTTQINSHASPLIRWIPMEDWNPTTNVATNALIPISNVANGSGVSTFTNFYDCPSYNSGAPSQNTNGLTTIISASESHLYVWTCHDQFGANTSNFLGNFLVSEYSRDDAWNTPENGFPSWGMWGSVGTGHTAASDSGTVIRILNPNTGQNSTHVAPYTTYSHQGYNYSLKGRLSYYGGLSNTSSLPQVTSNNAPGSLGKMGTNPNYPPNLLNVRNSSNNVAFAISDIRVTPTIGLSDNAAGLHYGIAPVAYGSITAKSPYIYLFRTQYSNMDEFSIDGTTYVNLLTSNNNLVTNTAFCTTIIVKKV
jgi:hypothetical protein